MKRIVSMFGILTAAVVALLVIPVATAGAEPAQSAPSAQTFNLGPVQLALGGDAIEVTMNSGAVKQVGNDLVLSNAQGVVKERVPLTVRTADGQSYALGANVAADGKSARLVPNDVKLPNRPLKQPRSKEQAYNNMMKLWDQNAACVAPAAAVGALIGLFFIVGWIVGGLIGAYVGLDNCGRGVWGDRYHGETIRAFWTWWNWG